MVNLFNKIYTGTLKQYENASIEANALYMVYDETTKVKSMYHGETKVAGDFVITETTPTTPEQGVIYYIAKFGDAQKPYVGFYNGTDWVALSDSATIEALDARIKALEDWKEETPFVEWSVRGDRKHIVLDNHDNILGVGTDGNEYNLARVSKWDVADFGSASLPMNLNSKDGKVTINDDKVVATLDDVQSTVEGLDVEDVEVAGSVVVAVSEENGKVSNVKKAVTVAVSTTTEGMEKTYDVKIGDTSVGKIDIPFCKAVLTNAELAKMDSIVSESDGTITTPEGSTADDALILVFQKADGKFAGVKVDVELFLKEAEFKNGLVVNEHKVSVNLGESNIYLTFGDEAEGSKSIQANVVTLADAHAAAEGVDAVTGLADALDVKTEIAKAVAAKNVDAEGEEGDSALVTASAEDNTVTVASTQKLKDAVTAAESAVQTIAVATEEQEVTVSDKSDTNGYTIGVTKATYAAAEEQTEKELSTLGLVDAAVLKAYVADEIAKNAVYWYSL